MAKVRSVDFLPEIFQTDVNKQFLAATLDQLIQEPKFKKTQGFVGRTVGPGVNPNEKYVVEPTKVRADYQLEAGIISLEPDTDIIKDAITYPGLLDSISYQGGNATKPDRLFERILKRSFFHLRFFPLLLELTYKNVRHNQENNLAQQSSNHALESWTYETPLYKIE